LKELISRYGSFSKNYYSHEVSWPHWDLLYIHSGDIQILYKDKTYYLTQGESVLIPPGIKFRIQNGKAIATASVQYFLPDEDSEVWKTLSRYHSIIQYKKNNPNSIEHHILELMSAYSPGKHINRKQELLLELIIEKMASSKSTSHRDCKPWRELINKYISMIDQSPTMEEVSRWAGYSPSRFRAIFQEEMGIQPFRYFLNLRMKKASEDLLETVLPIKEISLKLGYSNVTHFNRAFSKHFGLSPGRYRKENRFRG